MAPKRCVVTLKKEDKELIEKLSKRHKKPMSFIAGYLFEMCDKYDMMRVGWEARMEKADQERERYTGLNDACPALTFAKQHFLCVWGQDGKPPSIRQLARELDEALDVCISCDKTLKIKMQNESYQAQVQALEYQLREQSSKKFKVPNCKHGSTLNKDATQFENCPRNYGKSVLIAGYCKKLNNGQGCYDYKEIIVGVGVDV